MLRSKAEGGQGEEGIQIDWEHEGWEWYDPDDVVDREEFGGVPRLKESLRRVWFEGDIGERAGRILAAGLHRLQTDHESGSRELAGFALAVFKDVIAEMGEDVTDSRWWEKVRMAGWHLWKNGRESMGAAILNVVIAVLTDICRCKGPCESVDARQGHKPLLPIRKKGWESNTPVQRSTGTSSGESTWSTSGCEKHRVPHPWV